MLFVNYWLSASHVFELVSKKVKNLAKPLAVKTSKLSYNIIGQSKPFGGKENS
jgi:hypothetical protein